VPYYYFDAFDESWKTNESGVGTHWGLYQQSELAKPALKALLPPTDPVTLAQRSYLDIYTGSALEECCITRQWMGWCLLARPGE